MSKSLTCLPAWVMAENAETARKEQMTNEQKKIERIFQSAMNLRDVTPHRMGQDLAENQYASTYRRMYNSNPGSQDVKLFRLITREYRAFLRNSS